MKRFVSFALVGGLAILALDNDSASAQSCVGNRNMCDALDALQSAKSSLLRADSNKGGYRAQAMRSVDRAIVQVRNGIRHSQGR
jgi:hypothetical protein